MRRAASVVATALAACVVSVARPAVAMRASERHALVEQALALDAQGRAADAVPLLRRAAFRAGALGDSLTILLARSLVHTGTIEGRREAVRLYRKVLYRRADDIALRRELAELEDRRGFHANAKQNFEEIVRRHPDDASAAFEVARYESNLYTRTWSIDHLHEAIGATRRAARADTAECAQLLLALLLADDERYGEAEDMLGPPSRLHRDPRADLLRASCAWRRGEWARADEEFRRVLPRLGVALRRVYDDPAWLADSAAIASARATFRGSDSLFVEAQWKSVDPTPATRRNERRLEHWDRMLWADLLFTRADRHTDGWRTEPGIAWVRYGRPRDRTYTIASGLGGNHLDPSHWTWTYRIGPELREVNFYDHSFNGIFTLPWMTAAQGAETAEQVLALLLDGHPAYFAEEPRATFALGAEGGVVYDDGAPVFAYGIGVAAPFDTVGLSRRAKRRLPALRLGPYERQVAVFDTLWREVSLRVDTLSTAREWSAARGVAVWADTAHIGGGHVRVAVGLRDLRTGAHADGLYDVVAPRLGTRLAVSDPILAWWAGSRGEAAHGAPGERPWRLGAGFPRPANRVVVPNPVGRIALEEPLRVYFEVYRPAGAPVSTLSLTYNIAPVRKRHRLFGRRAGSTLASSTRDTARPGVDPHALEIDVERLDPGAYILTLTVRDEKSGETATSTATFTKAEPDGKYGRWKLAQAE